MKGRKNNKATDTETEQEKTIFYILHELKKLDKHERLDKFEEMVNGRYDRETIKNAVFNRCIR